MSAPKKKSTRPEGPLPDVAVYAVGLCYASACVKKGTKRVEVEREVNAQSPTGIGSRWQVCRKRKFADGSPNPGPCEDHEDRRHILLEC